MRDPADIVSCGGLSVWSIVNHKDGRSAVLGLKYVDQCHGQFFLGANSFVERQEKSLVFLYIFSGLSELQRKQAECGIL